MAKIPKEVMDLLNSSDSSKVLATRDTEGKVNAIPLYSLIAADDETVGFAELFIKKTKENLEKTKKSHCPCFQGTHSRLSIEGHVCRLPDIRSSVRENIQSDHG